MLPTLVDPRVCRQKFAREVENLKRLQADLRTRGWLIEATSFPLVRVTFLAGALQPPTAPLTVDLDFTNYNLWPPSVRFLHPVTFDPVFLPGYQWTPDGVGRPVVINGHPETNQPFLCLPGVREYHSHPQHDGDTWDRHRYTGEGTLYWLLDHVWRYCIESIKGYSIPVAFAQVALYQEAQP